MITYLSKKKKLRFKLRHDEFAAFLLFPTFLQKRRMFLADEKYLAAKSADSRDSGSHIHLLVPAHCD